MVITAGTETILRELVSPTRNSKDINEKLSKLSRAERKEAKTVLVEALNTLISKLDVNSSIASEVAEEVHQSSSY